MKTIKKLFFVLVLAMAMTVIWGIGVFAAGSFEYSYDAGNVVLTCTAIDETTAKVLVKQVTNGTTEVPVDVVIPNTVSNGGNTYTVAQILRADAKGGVIPVSSSGCVKTLTLPEGVNYIEGNLFSWEYTSTAKEIITPVYFYDFEFVVPDTAALLTNIPAYISDNYSDGAYYVNNCLVRVDPEYTGDFEVKSGTVCILASAFEGCSKIQKVTLPDSLEFIGVRAFANSSVTSVNLPKGLTGHSNDIAMFTFYGCDKLTDVNIDEDCDLGKIMVRAFMGCSSLKGFDFTTVEFIDTQAFADAFVSTADIDLKFANMGNGFGYGHFMRSGIRSLTFGTKNSYIPFLCFDGCTNLTTIVWDESVKTIGPSAFEGCSSLTEDVLGKENCKVTFLDYRAFARTAMTEVTIPETVTGLAGGVFDKVPSLTTLNWKTSSNIFTFLNAMLNDWYTTNFSSDDIMSGAKSTYSTAFNLPEKGVNTYLTTINIYVGNGTNVPSVFYNQPYLETVNIKFAAENIPNTAFQACPSLTSVNFDYPEALKIIGYGAFAGCVKLASFPFDKLTNLEVIVDNAFRIPGYGNELFTTRTNHPDWGLEEIDFSKCTSLKTIGMAAFSGQLRAKELTIPENVESINRSFTFMPSLEKVTIDCSLNASNQDLVEVFNMPLSSDTTISPLYGSLVINNSTIKEIVISDYGNGKSKLLAGFIALEKATIKKCSNLSGDNFVEDINLKELVLPDTETIACGYAGSFYGCASLEKITAPELKTIGEGGLAFTGLKSTEGLYAPKLESVGDYAFYNCNSLETIVIQKGVTYGKFAFASNNQCNEAYNTDSVVRNIIVEEGCTELSDFMFHNTVNKQKANVSLPSTLTKVNHAAFKGQKIDVVTIPESVLVIEDHAFMNTGAKFYFVGNPHIQTYYEDKDMGTGRTGTTIDDGSIVYYADEDAKTAINAYATEEGISLTTGLVSAAQIVEIIGMPEMVAAGGELTGFVVKIDGRVLDASEYVLDYDSSDMSLGERTVTLTLLGLSENGYVLQKAATAKSHGGETVSGYFSFMNAEETFIINVTDDVCISYTKCSLKDGELRMKIGNGRENSFVFTKTEKGWKIKSTTPKDAAKPYLSAVNGKVKYTDEANATEWLFVKKAFCIAEEKQTKYKQGRSWKTKTVTEYYYLTDTKEGARLGEDARTTVFYKANRNLHTYDRYIVREDTHTGVCTVCGKHDDAKEHAYDDTTHECVCGKYDPKHQYVSNITVTMKKETVTSGFLWWTYRETRYKYTVQPEAHNVHVAKIEYSLDNKHWEKGRTITSSRKVDSFYVRIKDSNGVVTKWQYKNGTVISLDSVI